MQVFSLEPITEVNMVEFFLYFLAYTGLAYVTAIIMRLLTKKVVVLKKPTKIIERMPLGFLLLATVIEELIFRGIPFLFGDERWILFGTVVWASIHFYLHQVVSAFIFGILLYRYWAGGLVIQAILTHLLFNLLGYALIKVLRYKE